MPNKIQQCENLLKQLKVSRKKIGKSEMCSGDKFKVTLSKGRKKWIFTYHCNYTNKSCLKDYLYSLLLDARSYDDNRDINSFFKEFGYKDIERGLKAFEGCKKHYKELHRFFTPEEIELLEFGLSDY